MSSEAEQAATNATIITKLEGMEANQVTLIDGLNRTRGESAAGREVIRQKVEDLATRVTEIHGDTELLNEKLEGHMEADENSFRLIWKVLLGGTGIGSAVAVVIGKVMT